MSSTIECCGPELNGDRVCNGGLGLSPDPAVVIVAALFVVSGGRASLQGDGLYIARKVIKILRGNCTAAPLISLLLEHTRFHPEEKDNDPEFANALARPAEIFVNDAFAAAHRAHASTKGVANYFPAVAGSLMEREIEKLSSVAEHPILSSDIIGDSHASIVDLSMTHVVDGDLLKVMSWDDNEWGHGAQMVREAVRMAKAS